MTEVIKIAIGMFICFVVMCYGMYIAKNDKWHKDNDFDNPKYNRDN